MVQQQLQVLVERIGEWTIRKGFNYLSQRRKWCILSTMDSMLQTLALYVNNVQIEVVNRVQFLILYFDMRLNGKVNIEKLERK